MGKYLSIITLNQQFPTKLRHEVLVNGEAVTYQSCTKSPFNHFSFLPNEQELKPSTSHEHTSIYEVSGPAVDWRSEAIRPYSGRIEYFSLHSFRVLHVYRNAFFFLWYLHVKSTLVNFKAPCIRHCDSVEVNGSEIQNKNLLEIILTDEQNHVT